MEICGDSSYTYIDIIQYSLITVISHWEKLKTEHQLQKHNTPTIHEFNNNKP